MNTETAKAAPKKILFSTLVLLLIALAYLWATHPLRKDKQPAAKRVANTIPWQQYTVKAGDSFSEILQHYNVNYSTTLAILKLKHANTLEHLAPGDSISIQSKDSKLLKLQTPLSTRKTLTVELKNNHYTSKITNNPVKIVTKFAAGNMQSSLSASFWEQHLPRKLLAQFEKIFSWKIDFKKDMRSGANYSIIYEEEQTTGPHKKVHTAIGPIILAQIQNNKKTLTALRYTTSNGSTDYYDASGNSLSGKFMKAPLHYTRVSSPFSLRRWHPILHEYRPHFGVDLAAPMNTPIYAAADGRILLHRTVKGYGRTIYIRHNFEYSTRYAHMHAYAKNLKTGSHVEKGQLIGYVGKSGLATGPHLHYEIRKFGIPRNPMTLPLPSADPIPHLERKQFLAFANNQIATLQNDEKHFALLNQNKSASEKNNHG